MIIKRDGKTYNLTAKEIEAAHREYETGMLHEDAQKELFEYAGIDCESLEDYDAAEKNYEQIRKFQEAYGMTPISACNPASSDYLLDEIISRYEDLFDINTPEQVRWEVAIDQVLKTHFISKQIGMEV